MRAFVFTEYGSPDVLRLREVATPVPEDDEVLIEVRAASVNDWDWSLVRGEPFTIRLLNGLFRPRNTIPGVDVAGRVEAVGAKVTKFRPGDEVYGDLSESGFGGFAEYVCASESALAPKPAAMNFAQAAALPHAAMLALQGLRDVGRLQPGETLLINGAGGGVGTLGIQIARTLGVEEVTGVDSAGKRDTLLALGFDPVLDYRREDFTTSGRRYDLILDVKTDRAPSAYRRALTPRGRYVTVGGRIPRLLQAFLAGKLQSLFGEQRSAVVALQPNRDLAYLDELFGAGRLEPVIDGPYSFGDLPGALRHFGGGGHLGKVVVVMDPHVSAGPGGRDPQERNPVTSEGAAAGAAGRTPAAADATVAVRDWRVGRSARWTCPPRGCRRDRAGPGPRARR